MAKVIAVEYSTLVEFEDLTAYASLQALEAGQNVFGISIDNEQYNLHDILVEERALTVIEDPLHTFLTYLIDTIPDWDASTNLWKWNNVEVRYGDV